MENLEQEPEKIPMDEVLSEIRHMLLKDTENHDSTGERSDIRDKTPTIEKVDYFLLTPEMRCDLSSKNRVEAVQIQTKKLLNKLQENKADEKLSPELEAWLNTHLPDMIEKAISKKLDV